MSCQWTPLVVPEQKVVDGKSFPYVVGPRDKSKATFVDLVREAKMHRRDILARVQLHGACLWRGFSDPTPEGFANFAEALNLEKYPYVGGAAPRTNVVRDVVFTTNESPPSEPIPFHHEIVRCFLLKRLNTHHSTNALKQSQVPNPPSYIMFYCETPSKKGGETPIIRSDHVADFFFKNFPKFAADVEEKGVRYIRTMPLENDNSSAIGRSWKSTFQCETKEEAEEAMRKIGTDFEWLSNGDVKTTSAVVPAIRTDLRSGRKMFFNSMVAAFTGWIDSRNVPEKAVVLGDFSPVDAAAMNATAEFMMAERVAVEWKRGDIIVIDNFNTMHSRNVFERPRRILAAIGGPSNDGFSIGSGIRASEVDEGLEIPLSKRRRVVDASPPPHAPATRRENSMKLLRTGDDMPVCGLGMWKVSKADTADVVYTAVQKGWRHFDCACDYGNEYEVGLGLKRAMKDGLCAREDLFITSKLWNTYHDPEHVGAACARSVEDLGLDYVDLYLIHFPSISLKFVPFDVKYPPEWVHPSTNKMEFARVPLHKTWQAMENLVDLGLARNIGLCNVGVSTLIDVLSYCRFAPQVLQVEIHPYNVQTKLCEFCLKNGIFVVGFSPLGAGSYVELDMAKESESALKNEKILKIAQTKKKSPAQVLLRWGIQSARGVIPKTTKTNRLVENLNVFDFELSPSEMKQVSSLDRNKRFNDPGEFCVGMGGFCPIYE